MYFVLQMADRATQNNKTNQKNPDHKPSGPGAEAGYKGTGNQKDLDNHGNQLNPKNKEFRGGQQNQKWIIIFSE